MARRPLRVGSTFSGVGGADLGLERAGFELAWTCEWDDWKRSVLAAHWPSVEHYCDVRNLIDPEPVDLLCGGFPCQDLSVAGKRAGFDGERSVLAFEFLRIAESLRPRWLLMENVPGLLSSNGGRDLARLLDELGACGYGWAYRILDARYFGVPQRRRRIFIVARRADAELNSGAAAALALRAVWEGSGGDSTPGWPPREVAASGARCGAEGGRIVGALSAQWYTKYTGQEMIGQGQLVTDADERSSIAYRKSARVGADPDSPETWVDDGLANTLNGFDVGDVRTTHAVVAHGVSAGDESVAGTLCSNGKGGQRTTDISGAYVAEAEHATVRRLTPVECERLMGWPDNWTAPEGVKAPDSRRYAACGDGIVSWVAYWIGCRIRMIEDEA